MTKNVHLPLERAYLSAAVQDGMFKVPPRSLEMIVFVIRMMLKHASWDAILTGTGTPVELGASRARASSPSAPIPTRSSGCFASTFRSSTPRCSERCRQAVEPGAARHQRVARSASVAAGTRHAQPAAPERRHGDEGDAPVPVRVRPQGARPALAKAPGRRRLPHRRRRRRRFGQVVVGPGPGQLGSGATSTCAASTSASRDGRCSRTLVRTPIRAARLVGAFSSTRLPADATIGAPCPGRAWLVWHALNARDRRRTYARARRFATEGGIAICDRYPTPQLSLMDGSRVAHLAGIGRPGTGRAATRPVRVALLRRDPPARPDARHVGRSRGRGRTAAGAGRCVRPRAQPRDPIGRLVAELRSPSSTHPARSTRCWTRSAPWSGERCELVPDDVAARDRRSGRLGQVDGRDADGGPTRGANGQLGLADRTVDPTGPRRRPCGPEDAPGHRARNHRAPANHPAAARVDRAPRRARLARPPRRRRHPRARPGTVVHAEPPACRPARSHRRPLAEA